MLSVFALRGVVNQEEDLQGDEDEEAAAHVLYEIVVAPSKLNCIVCLLYVANREKFEEDVGYEKHLHLREAH